jgi:hypothetical protein
MVEPGGHRDGADLRHYVKSGTPSRRKQRQISAAGDADQLALACVARV